MVMAAEFDKIKQFIIIEATNDHSIDLDWIHPDSLSRRKPFKHGLQFASLRDFSESVGLRVSRLTLMRSSPASFSEAACSPRRAPFVVRDKVRRPSMAAELSDQGWETSPNERFTSGQPNLATP